jgi:hypothetical protein
VTTLSLVNDTNGGHMTEQQPYRPMCRHGVIPTLEVQQVSLGTGAFNNAIPGRTELVYDCPTPDDCATKAYRYLIDAGVEPPRIAQ